MNKGFKVLTTVLILVIGILSITSGFFFAKSSGLEKQLKGDVTVLDENSTSKTSNPLKTDISTTDSTIVTPSPSPSITPSVSPSATPKTTVSPTPTTTVTPKSGASGTYTVVSGDTMYSIALKLKINWLDLAKANGLDETTANKIKIGQVLTLP